MIWVILSLSPLLLFVVWAFKIDAYAFALTVLTIIVIVVCFFLFSYGAWELGWFEHCGDFWESANCP